MAMHSDTFTNVLLPPTASVFERNINCENRLNSIQLLTKATKKQKQIQYYYAKTDTVRSTLD